MNDDFPDPESPIINILCRWSGICGQFGLCFFYAFFYNIIKVNLFLHCFIILLDLVFPFLRIKSLLVLFAYVSNKSIDFILLSSLALNAILMTFFSVKT